MKRYISYFSEKRSHSEMNPHISAWDYVEKYKDDSDVYITFTQIDKVGINPQSKFNTPNGIYTYPLKEFFNKYIDKKKLGNISDVLKAQKSVGDFSPYAGEANYITFLRVKKEAGKFINNIHTDYTLSDFNKDIGILKEKYLNSLSTNNFISKKVYYTGSDVNTTWESMISYNKEEKPFRRLMLITASLSDIGSKKSWSDDYHINTNKWNSILHHDLGYSGFADKSEKGYIHISEPMQAIFLTTSAFEVIARLENNPSKSSLSFLGFEPKDIKVKIGDRFVPEKSKSIYTVKDIDSGTVIFNVENKKGGIDKKESYSIDQVESFIKTSRLKRIK